MHIVFFTCITLACSTAAVSMTADTSMPPGRAGYAVTFDGRGTDIATAQLAPEIFLGARGLTLSLWCRAFGFSSYPTESVVLSMLTRSEDQWLVPIRWRAHGAALDHVVFGTSTYEAASVHMDAFEQWRHFTFTWNADSGAVRTYVDGQLASDATNVKQGYNVTAGAADGVLLALGVHALGPTSHAPAHSFRGSIDHLQLWTVHLNAEQVVADYRTLGDSPALPMPALRYTFDEGSSDVAANTGATEGADLHLGRNPDGVRYFTSGDATAWQYTSPVWAPSSLPLLESTAARLAPIVVSFRPGINERITLTTSAAPCQISHLPSHGELVFNGHALSLGGLVPPGAILTFASTNETALSTSFKLECAVSSLSNVAVHLLLEVAPQVVPMPTQCSWPLGVLQCTSLHLSTIVPKDSPTIIFLIGRSFHGSDRTTAVVLAAPRTGFLYQLDSCCDPVTGRGVIIRDGDQVLHGSSGVVYVPERDAPDDCANVTFLVLDSRGAKSAPAIMSIYIRRVMRRVDDVPGVENMSRSSALAPIDVPLRVREADALTVKPRLTTVRLGVLLPMFGTQVVGYNQELWSPRLGVYQALREINNKSDGVADGLLPNTNLVFAYRDSKCDATVAISGSLQLISSAFDGQGVSAIIGGGCSSASVAATQVSDATFGIPIISPSSTSPDLSDGTLYRSFLRTCPSDSFQIEAIFELFQLLFNYSGTAGLVTSSDSYGTGFSTAFRAIARNKGLSTLVLKEITTLSNFEIQYNELRESKLRFFVIALRPTTGSLFLRGAFAQGLAGPGYLWLGSDSISDQGFWQADSFLLEDEALRLQVLRGFFCVRPRAARGPSYDLYKARRGQLVLSQGNLNASTCNLQTDDDGSYIWAQDHDANASTPLACAGVDPSAGVLAYEPYAYDATFALAYALHHLIEVQNRSEVVGSELIDALIKHVQFEGASGLVDFFDASDEPTRWYHGDRRVGTAYSLMNYADNEQGLVEVGSWTPCQAAPCDWSERWHPILGVGLRFSTTDNSRPPLYAPPRVTTVRLGVLLPMFGTQAVGYSRVLWSPRLGVYQALKEINNKSDGVADELLPSTKLVFAYRDSKCDETHSISAGLQLTQDVFGGAGVNAIIGAGCSEASATAARVAAGSRIPIISPSSTSPTLSDGREYPYFLRTPPSDKFISIGMVDVLQNLFNYSRVALVYSSDLHAAAGARSFSEEATRSGLALSISINFVENTVDFSVHHRKIQQSGSRVIALFCQALDGANFIRSGIPAGIGGEGFLWMTWENSLTSHDFWSDDTALRLQALRGLYSFSTNYGKGSPLHDRFLERRRMLNSSWCSAERDMDGSAYLWKQDHDLNASTPLECAGDYAHPESMYDSFGYDAVFALAHAIHDLVEVQNRTEIEGLELLNTLVERVSFQGLTGLVDFYDASEDPTRLYHGDRRVGFSYNLLNYVDHFQGLVNVGYWMPCQHETCAWSQRWHPSAGTQLTFSTSDNQRPSEIAPTRVTVVRLGVLLPTFGAFAHSSDLWGLTWSPRVGVFQALRELNNKSDGISDDLLPDTQVHFAYADSRCSPTDGMVGALSLATKAFGDNPIHAIIGAGCSSASVPASHVASLEQIPLISPSAVDPGLSDGILYPNFLRVVPSDDFASVAIADLLRNLLNYTSVALVHSSEAYSFGASQAFETAASQAELEIKVKVRFTEFTKDTDELKQLVLQLTESSSRVIVIFSLAVDGSNFIRTAIENGVGGPGYVWISGMRDVALLSNWIGDPSLHERAFKGFLGLDPSPNEESQRYTEYLARRQKLPPIRTPDGQCSQETDDTGRTFLWAFDDDDNASTPLACTGDSLLREASYDAFGYDAVFAFAHALHELIEVQNRTEVVGAEVLETLINKVRFEGLTGIVDFFDASTDPDRQYHGDRRTGFQYKLVNYVDATQGLVTLGSWAPCVASSCDFLERWTPSGKSITFSSDDNSRPSQSAPTSVTVVYIGVLLPMFLPDGRDALFSSTRRAIFQALREINNKTDGVADNLLPKTHIQFAYRDSKCERASSLEGTLDLVTEAFGVGVSAIIGAGCSTASLVAAQIAGASARGSSRGSAVPIISPSATSSTLSDGAELPYFLRTAPSDAYVATAMVDVLHSFFQYKSVALVYSTDSYGVGGAESFLSAASAVKLNVQETPPFPSGGLDFSGQHRILKISGARVIALFCKSIDCGAFMRIAYFNGIGGEGYLWLGGDSLASSSLWENDHILRADMLLRERVFKGMFVASLNVHHYSTAYHQFQQRRRALPFTTGDGTSCNLERDDDDFRYLWAEENHENRSIALKCAGDDPTKDGIYDGYGYDATFALAHALHDLVEVQNHTEIEGSYLLHSLIKRVRFEGVTGLVDFYDASDDPNRLYHGDRRVGFSFNISNYVSNMTGMVTLGIWTSCARPSCPWSERWQGTGAQIVYSTPDNERPPEVSLTTCPFGEVLTAEGECECTDGYERDSSNQFCRPCETGRDSQGPAPNRSSSGGCTMCAVHFYRPSPYLPASHCTPCDILPGVVCPDTNTTIESLVLQHGYWRHSVLTTTTFPCTRNGGWSPCRGGSRVGNQGDGYCEPGYSGVRCEVCMPNGQSMYFDKLDGRCNRCDNIFAQPASRLMVFLLGVVILFCLFLGFIVNCTSQGEHKKSETKCTWCASWLATRSQAIAWITRRRVTVGPSASSKTSSKLFGIQRIQHMHKLWRRAGVSYKLKLVVAFYQCVAAVPSVFGISLPESLKAYASFINFLEAASEFGVGIGIPPACFGSYRARLLVSSLWPIVLVLAVSFVCVCWELMRERRKDPALIAQRDLSTAVGTGVQRALPLTLLVTFLVTPSTSGLIFKTFLCNPIEYDTESKTSRRYLFEDLSLDCDSEEYAKTADLARGLIFLWPIGVPLLYAVLLWASRRALVTGRSTPTSRATAFLWESYQSRAFWWEPLEMCRKLALTGWVLLIQHDAEQARILVAILVSVIFLAMHLSIQPFRRAEDSAMLLSIELVLVLIYICVLLIKVCGESAVVCSTFGLGPTSDGVYTFFVAVGLVILLAMGLLGLLRIWIEGHVPKILLLGRAHAVSPATICYKVIARKLGGLKHQLLMYALSLDTTRLNPRTLAAIYQFRSSRGRPSPANPPMGTELITKGNLAELYIEGVFPRTTCFVQVDVEAFAIRWTHDQFVSLHGIQKVMDVQDVKKRRSRLSSLFSPAGRKFPGIIQFLDEGSRKPSLQEGGRKASAESGRKASAEGGRKASEEGNMKRWSIFTAVFATNKDSSSRSSVSSQRDSRVQVLRIMYSDRCGVVRVLELSMPAAKAALWAEGLRSLLDMVPRDAPPAFARWALGCMEATSARGKTGFLCKSELRALLRRANASSKIAASTIEAALKSVEENDLELDLPACLRGGCTSISRRAELLNARTVIGVLLRLCTSSPTIRLLFTRFTANDRMSSSEWMSFVRSEQVNRDRESVMRCELSRHELEFEEMTSDGAVEFRSNCGLSMLQFGVLLLNPKNSAVLPLSSTDVHKPLAHYWAASSHNSYIVGDQLTGLSSANMYRRILLQGCRQVEIDCWDGREHPIVTHGFTFCTVVQFEEVAKAVAECAFVTSEMPLMLSLEMHCSVAQQHILAKCMVKHFGDKLLCYDELASMWEVRPPSLHDFKHRILVKARVVPRVVAESSSSLGEHRHGVRRRLKATTHAIISRLTRTSSARSTWSTRSTAAVAETSVTNDTAFRPTLESRATDAYLTAEEASDAQRTLKAKRHEPSKKATDEFYGSNVCVRSMAFASYMNGVLPTWKCVSSSVDEDRLLSAIGVPRAERDHLEGLLTGSKLLGKRGQYGLTEEQLSSRAIRRLAANPPPQVGDMQRRTAEGNWLLRPFPHGLRFSSKNMNPLPCWLAGAHNVCLNMSTNDLPMQLHFALFKGSGGYVLKPAEMRVSRCTPGALSNVEEEASDCCSKGLEETSFTPMECVEDGQDDFWPPPRSDLHCTTIEFISLHNLPKRSEQRPRFDGSRGECHKYHQELSGYASPPDNQNTSSPALSLSLHPIGGFCAVSKTLPLEQQIETEFTTAAIKGNGMNAELQERVHFVAAEPHATFIRVSLSDAGQEVAYETAVLGRFRRGYRTLQLRSPLGTQIELCVLFVNITFSKVTNLWLTPRQLRLQQANRGSHGETRSEELAQLQGANAELKQENQRLSRKYDLLRTEVVALKSTLSMMKSENALSNDARQRTSVRGLRVTLVDERRSTLHEHAFAGPMTDQSPNDGPLSAEFVREEGLPNSPEVQLRSDGQPSSSMLTDEPSPDAASLPSSTLTEAACDDKSYAETSV